MSYDWLKLQCAKNGVEVPPRHMFITVSGTGVPDPFGPSFSHDVADGLDDELFFWQPIGYPAETFNMGASVQAGVQEVLNQIDLHLGTFAMSGYSQGAMVTDYVWRDHLLTGSHAHRKDDCFAIVNFGDPMRCPGISNGNSYAGFPLPQQLDGYTTGGIAGPADLTAAQTPPFLLSCNLDGDLYGAAPVGDNPATSESQVGKFETLIFDSIQGGGAPGVGIGEVFIEWVTTIAGIALLPLVVAIPLAQAIINGIGFAAAGPAAPHWQYGPFVPAMVDFVTKRGKATPVRTS